MLKKLFKVVTTLTLLVGAYFGYVHAFAIVVEQLKAIKRTDNFVFVVRTTRSRSSSRSSTRARSLETITGPPTTIWPTAITTPSAVTGSTPRSVSGSSRKTACATTASAFD